MPYAKDWAQCSKLLHSELYRYSTEGKLTPKLEHYDNPLNNLEK